MDGQQIFTMAINAGGFGVFGAAMLWLFVTAAKQYREELRQDRDAFAARNRAVVEALEKQTAVLAQALDRVHEDLRQLQQHAKR